MKSRVLQALIFSLVGVGSLALGVSLLSYLSAQNSLKPSQAPRAQFASIDEAAEQLLTALQRFHHGCAVIESKRFDTRKRAFVVDSSDTGGNPFLLYAYTEIYKHTRQEKYWQLASEQAHCLEQSIQSYIATGEMYQHPWMQKSRGDKREAFAWGTYLLALAYFHQINRHAPTYLIKIADFLVALDTDYKDIKRVAQSEERRIRGLLRYYDLTNEQNYLKRAAEVMKAISLPPADLGTSLPGSPYVAAKYLRAYCELYARLPEDWVLASLEEFTKAIDSFMNSLRGHSDEVLVVLAYYQIAVAADACWEATSREETFVQMLQEALSREIANIGLDGGIIEYGERMTVSLNAEIARLLIKYKQKLKLNP